VEVVCAGRGGCPRDSGGSGGGVELGQRPRKRPTEARRRAMALR
jgi:hypothetical protein